MNGIKETGNRFSSWFGNGKKMLTGGILFIVGMVIQSFSSKTLEQNAFMLMTAGLMCLVNALFSKISRKNINLFLYLLINLGIVEAGIFFTSYNLMVTETDTFSVAAVWCVCAVLIWLLQALILQAETWGRRLLYSFLETLMSALAAVIAFVVPIFLSVWI